MWQREPKQTLQVHSTSAAVLDSLDPVILVLHLLFWLPRRRARRPVGSSRRIAFTWSLDVTSSGASKRPAVAAGRG